MRTWPLAYEIGQANIPFNRNSQVIPCSNGNVVNTKLFSMCLAHWSLCKTVQQLFILGERKYGIFEWVTDTENFLILEREREAENLWLVTLK